MSHAQFVPLRVFSSFTMLEGAIEPKAIAKIARKLGFPGVGLADRNGLYGAMAFSDACKGEGVQPIIGSLVGVGRPNDIGGGTDAIDWLALYAQDETGYDNLCDLVSAAHLERPDGQAPHVTLDRMAGRTDGLICLTAAGEGALVRLLADGQASAAALYLDRLQALFGDRLYVELARRNEAAEEMAEGALLDLAYARDLPIVGTNPACFAEPDFHAAHDVMLCIASSSYVDSEDRQRSSPQSWLKPADEMRRIFDDLPEAIANTLVVAQRCAVAAPQRKPILPSLAGDIEGEKQALRDQAEAGLAMRLEKAGIADAEERRIYAERLDFEIRIINQMGCPGYFLIVADFIKWAKSHDIPVGPGRGSGA
ncbi:MAG: PHP domain-containing protein, partial [Sphingobium sp.]